MLRAIDLTLLSRRKEEQSSVGNRNLDMPRGRFEKTRPAPEKEGMGALDIPLKIGRQL